MATRKRKPKPLQVDSFRLLGKTWALRRHQDSIGDACGVTHHAQLTIDIDATQGLEHVQDTMLHEIMHAISDEVTLALTEEQVSRLATVLLGAMKDNPEVCAFIFAQG